MQQATSEHTLRLHRPLSKHHYRHPATELISKEVSPAKKTPRQPRWEGVSSPASVGRLPVGLPASLP